ncbi:cytochrome P450 2H2-like [Erythrolamprus reginae]|uniref:cytochrome P450 2H2-like n=1 Tax=Erythrolamprus reginae TaxID=121349 RepID=UPI00396C6428
MELIPETIILFILFLFIFWAFRFQQARGRFPPGPRPWLFLGNLLQKGILPLYKNYSKLSKKYGPVFTIWVGPKPIVVICGYEAVKNALVTHNEEFGGRPAIPILDQITKGNGLISENKKWNIMRRFTLTTLRNFGMGRKPMAERISEESQHLVKKITTFEDQPFDIILPITSAVSNVICSVVFGNRLTYEGKTFSELLEIVEAFTEFLGNFSGMVYSALPNIMKSLPGPHKKIFSDCNKICDFVRNEVDAHKKTLDPDNPRDYIDCFLLKLEKEKDSSVLSAEDLVMSVFQLFIAGTDSTSSFIVFGLNLLARFPNVQAKAQEEIDDVVGANRSPSIEDRIKLPYVNAFAHEVLRFLQSSNNGIPRMTTQDVIFKGHFIPKGTTVFPLAVSVHFDPLCWEQPKEFDPGHFLNEEGKFQKKDAYIPFSTGKRACSGEALADMELFLFFANLLQNFTFELTMDPEEIDLEDLYMGCRKNGKYSKLRAIKRETEPIRRFCPRCLMKPEGFQRVLWVSPDSLVHVVVGSGPAPATGNLDVSLGESSESQRLVLLPAASDSEDSLLRSDGGEAESDGEMGAASPLVNDPISESSDLEEDRWIDTRMHRLMARRDQLRSQAWWWECHGLGCMSAVGTGKLQFIKRAMNANMYCDILKQSMIPSIWRLGCSPVSQHDNDPKYISKMTTTLLKKLRVNVMGWLSMSPDLY